MRWNLKVRPPVPPSAADEEMASAALSASRPQLVP